MSANAPGIIKARPSAYNMIDPRSIDRRAGWNNRFDFGEIEELAKSIKYQATEGGVPGGLLNTIRVKRLGDRFELIDGDRRLTAVELLIKWAGESNPRGYDFPEGIPAIIVDKNQDDLRSLIQMFEANTGKPLLPLEEAAAYKRMREAGMTLEQIASAVGRNHVHVNNTLALLEAPEELRQAMAKGEIGGTMAKKIATAARKDQKKAAELTKQAVAAGKDKKKQRQVKAAIEETRQERASKQGKTLKIKPLSEDQLSEQGEKMSKQLAELLKDAGLASAEALLSAVAADNRLAAAYTLGCLRAFKVAAGMKINLKV